MIFELKLPFIANGLPIATGNQFDYGKVTQFDPEKSHFSGKDRNTVFPPL